ncbi:MAG: hypothetical protein JO095_12515 [Alphaproteobacteria bacterium]|nr:hypothetical protein [Alphaproteobacteria bacterium]
MLDVASLKSAGEKLITPASRRAAALRLIERGYSQRRACGLTEVDPRTVRRARGQGDAMMIRERLHRFAAERRRFGYRRLGIVLEREGI